LDIWLFDVHVERVEQEAEIVRAHSLDQFQSLRRGADLTKDWFRFAGRIADSEPPPTLKRHRT
jgi:hypothetical protein